MVAFPPELLILDFDGVICDGMEEYFASSKRVYRQIWTDTPVGELDCQGANFRRLRPVIETGWEMPLLLRALMLGIDPLAIEQDWPTVCQRLQDQEKVGKPQLAPALDQVRDDYINNELYQWLALHHFYPGVAVQLGRWLTSDCPHWTYIVTTKEGRFVQQLLAGQQIAFPLKQIIGKEIRQPKADTLVQLLAKHQLTADQLWFVEDLLSTLQSVANNPDLAATKLFLADWGYNTAAVRASLKDQNRFHLLSLAQFTASFSQW